MSETLKLSVTQRYPHAWQTKLHASSTNASATPTPHLQLCPLGPGCDQLEISLLHENTCTRVYFEHSAEEYGTY